MKKLSIEEKAKAYDEALERAKVKLTNEVAEDIFPELKESEDEESKKWILEYLYDGMRKSDEQFKGQFKAAIAWLEKQGEQKVVTWHDVSEEPEIYVELLCECKSDYSTWHTVAFYDVSKSFEYGICHKVENVTRWCYIADLVGKQGQKETNSYCKENCKGYQETGKCYADGDCEAKRKAEQMSADNKEIDGEDYGIDGLWHAQRILEETLGSVDGYQTDDGILDHKAAITAVKKLYGQKPAWSEKDERMVKDTIALVETIEDYNNAPDGFGDVKFWLKSLKDRVQPQSQWKPSEEQMKFLWLYAEQNNYDGRILGTLYNDLKKLRGE